MSPAKKIVMISSTARDLPQHRKEVMDACLRQGMFPVMMEHLPANDDDAISASLKLVDEADVYIGVFAHRYGYTPKGHDISVTEMEYNRAVERKIPRLIFVIDNAHPVRLSDVETGDGATKLDALKKRIFTENIVNFFNSPADLRAHVINSLSQLQVPGLMAFHYVRDIPAPPEPFIAHPYTLLQTHRLVGRHAELNLLTDWVAKRESEIYAARILNVVAIGGMGKSALTWKWFNEVAPQEMKPMSGRMWWSFYESDATFEIFVTRALAYVTRRPLAEVEQIPAPDREALLLSAFDREPFLIVLDGLEQLMIAYAQIDGAHLSDDDYDQQTSNRMANTYDLPGIAAQSFTGKRRLRWTADARASSFLRKLSRVRAARILVSTRLYPADLQTRDGNPLPGCFSLFLGGLTDDDALDLWRALGVSGARDSLLPLFHRVDNHAQLIQVLGSQVARYRRAPGDFDRWRHDHPDFDPFSLPLVQVKSHVLEVALRGLDDKTRSVLHTIASLRKPVSYESLESLLVGAGKLCDNESELDATLTELEDRSLLGFDIPNNRYHLHPLVLGVLKDILVIEEEVKIQNEDREYSSKKIVFVSYARTDWQDYARPIVELFAKEGIKAWVDQNLLEGGQIWLDEINKALEMCDCLVLCISPESLESKWVKMEYRYFFTEGKPIVPVICQPAKLPAELRLIQHLEFSQLDSLVRVLRSRYL